MGNGDDVPMANLAYSALEELYEGVEGIERSE
jgi:hypothetical protein